MRHATLIEYANEARKRRDQLNPTFRGWGKKIVIIDLYVRNRELRQAGEEGFIYCTNDVKSHITDK